MAKGLIIKNLRAHLRKRVKELTQPNRYCKCARLKCTAPCGGVENKLYVETPERKTF